MFITDENDSTSYIHVGINGSRSNERTHWPQYLCEAEYNFRPLVGSVAKIKAVWSHFVQVCQSLALQAAFRNGDLNLLTYLQKC